MTFAIESHETFELLTCASLRERGVPHGFTLRSGGFGSRERGAHDRLTLARALGLSRLARMQQVHGRTVRKVEKETVAPACDGFLSSSPGLALIVESADCVPLLLWESGGNAVAAIHAGWRGSLARVAAETVKKLETDLGANPEHLHVAIGPAIRSCCFEVGDEVVEAFTRSGRYMEGLLRPGRRERRHLDLVEDNRRQLAELGVPRAQIYDSGRCTVCENERFYSYRKEGSGVGRVMGVIGIR